jgi:hypothetical protein
MVIRVRFAEHVATTLRKVSQRKHADASDGRRPEHDVCVVDDFIEEVVFVGHG